MNAAFTPTRMRISVERYQKMVATGVLTKDDRIELIEGEMIDMAPIGRVHSAVTAQLHEWFVARLAAVTTVVSAGPLNLGDFSEPQPDLMLLKRRSDFYRSKIPEAADVLLLIEISETSLQYDQTTKLKLYARYGIPDYWIVNVPAKRIIVNRRPSGENYVERTECAAPQVVAPLAFPSVGVSVGELLP